MNRKSKVFFGLVAAVAAALLIGCRWVELGHLTSDQFSALLTLTSIGALSEILAVSYNVGRGTAASSIAFVPFLASVIILPPPAAFIVALVSQGIDQAMHAKQAWKALFNISQGVISLACAIAIYKSFGGVPGAPAETLNVLNFAALAFAFFFANQVLISHALALVNSERLSNTFLTVIGKGGTNLLYDILVSPLAAIVVLLYTQWDVAGVLLVILPLLLIRHSYVSNQELRAANHDLLRVLVKAIETRDPYTSGHSVRVSVLAKRIAEDLDLPPGKVEAIETAALVHDIGKVDMIYAELIRKQAALSDTERRVIVTHAAKGAEFLRTLSSFKGEIISAVRHHHERYDGSGYPDGLVGEDIPLAARIIMLCDSIDAMLSDRPYRKALTIEYVRQELLRHSGSQFDPRIVLNILKRNTLERAAEQAAPTNEQASPNRRISVAV